MFRIVWSAIAAIVLLCTPAYAEPYPEEAQADFDASRAFIEAELTELADWCLTQKCATAAWRELRRIVEIYPVAREPVKRIRALIDQPDAYSASFKKAYARKKKQVLGKCARRLLKHAKLCEKLEFDRGFESAVTTIQHHLEGAANLKRLKLKYFPPYGLWVREETWHRLKKGEERLEGEWLTRNQVADVNLAHTYPDEPWKYSAGPLTIVSHAPVRDTLTVLYQVQRAVRFTLASYAGLVEMDEREPRLEILLASSREHFEAMAAQFGATTAPNTCVQSFERGLICTREVARAGGARTLPLAQFLPSLHATAAFVSLLMKTQPLRGREPPLGGGPVSLAIAGTISGMHLTADGWAPIRRSKIPTLDGSVDSPFAWSKKRVEHLPGFRQLLLGREVLPEYRAAMFYFLMNDARPEYRRAWITYLQQCLDRTLDRTSYDDAFEDIDSRIDDDFESFLETFEFEG